MKWLVSIICGVIAAFAAFLPVFGVLAGIAWLFLFGDNKWPKWAEGFILFPAIAAGVAIGGVTGWAVWTSIGKVQNKSPSDARIINWTLLLGAVGLVAAIVVWSKIDPAWASHLVNIIIVTAL